MESATTDSDVALTKTITVSGDRLTVDYRIAPSGAAADRVRLVEQFSKAVERTAVSFEDHDRGQWTYLSEHEVSFSGTVSGSEPLEATLQIQSEQLTADDCASTVTAVDGGPGTNGDRSVTGIVGDADTDITGPARRDDGHHDRPAVAVVATDGNAAGAARTIARATDRGLSVFAAVDVEQDAVARIAEQLGAVVVRLAIGDRDPDELAAALAGTAQSRSYPGILFHGECQGRIAFTESLERFDAEPQTITEAVPESARTDVLVGIPAYNEAETVGTVVSDAREHADEVLVVDDGSDDETAEIAREAGATVVEHDRNRGYGHALKTLFGAATERDPDSLVVLDADDQHDPGDIPRLVEKQADAELVIGSRFGQSTETDAPTYRRAGLWVITVLTNLSFGTVRRDERIRDTQSGFRAYDATAVELVAEHADSIDDRMSASIDILSIANANDLTIEEVPTTISYDVDNASTQNPVTHGVSIVNTILKTLERNRPVAVLGVPGVLVALAGVGVGHWTLSNYVSTGTLPAEFTVLSALLILVGTLSSFFSVVRHALNGYFDELCDLHS